MSIIKRKAGSEDIVKSILEFDSVPTEGSPNLVESGAVAKALANSGKIAVFECMYSQDAQGYVYPTPDELNAARLAGKLPVIVEISHVGGSTYYVATQMSSYRNNVKFHFVDSETGAMLKLEGPTSNPTWSTGSARGSRYTTRTETVSAFQTANINEGESVLYKATSTKNHVTIFCPAGCTDAQVIISAATAQPLQLDKAVVKIGNKNIPVVDLRPRNYNIRPSEQHNVLISTHLDGSGYGPPESFDDFALAEPAVLDTATYLEYKTETHSNNIIIMITGQAAFIYAE